MLTSEDFENQQAALAAQTNDVVVRILQRAATVTQLSLEFDEARSLLWMTIRPEPKPIFTLQLLESIHRVQGAIISLWGQDRVNCPVKFIAYRSTGPIFTLGGDLEFYLECLAKGDLGGLRDYARLSAEGVINNITGLGGLAISIATVHGKGLGGGIDASRSCNVMIAEEQATLGYPEIAFNHFPILAAPILKRRIGPQRAQEFLMRGEEYSAHGFEQLGLLDAVVARDTGEDWVRNFAKSNLATHGARLTLFAYFVRAGGDVEREMREAGEVWANYMFTMKPTDIAKLQRIAMMQDRMLARLYRETPSLQKPLSAA